MLFRSRREFFDGDLFGEPAWDILLDLYICEKKGERVSITAACLGAGVPETTALRWLKQLEKGGLLLREADRRDARRSFIRLSELGYAKMTAYLKPTARRCWAGRCSWPPEVRIRTAAKPHLQMAADCRQGVMPGWRAPRLHTGSFTACT